MNKGIIVGVVTGIFLFGIMFAIGFFSSYGDSGQIIIAKPQEQSESLTFNLDNLQWASIQRQGHEYLVIEIPSKATSYHYVSIIHNPDCLCSHKKQ